jgi:hypothetical protein
MIRVIRDRENDNFNVTEAACDLCGRGCPGARRYGSSYWEAATAVLDALRAGWAERFLGRLRQLLCPGCAKKARPPARPAPAVAR